MPTLGLLQFLCSKHGIKDTIWLVIFFFFFFVSREPFVKLKTVLFLWCGVSKIWHKSYCMIGNFCKGHFSQVESHLPLVSWFIFSTALLGLYGMVICWGDFPKPNIYLVLATKLHQFHCLVFMPMGGNELSWNLYIWSFSTALVWNGEGGIWQFSSLLCAIVLLHIWLVIGSHCSQSDL